MEVKLKSSHYGMSKINYLWEYRVRVLNRFRVETGGHKPTDPLQRQQRVRVLKGKILIHHWTAEFTCKYCRKWSRARAARVLRHNQHVPSAASTCAFNCLNMCLQLPQQRRWQINSQDKSKYKKTKASAYFWIKKKMPYVTIFWILLGQFSKKEEKAPGT